MTAFPTLNVKPLLGTKHEVIDNSLKSETVNGMTLTRKQYSRQLQKFSLNYPAMYSADLNTLKTFYESCNGGSASFTWIDDGGISHNVRFDSNLSYYLVAADLWTVSFTLAEV